MEEDTRIYLRSVIMLGFFVALFAGAILAVADGILHIHRTTNEFWSRPTQIGAIVAYLYLLSPFLKTIIYAVRTGRITNGFIHWAYSPFLTVLLDLGITYGIIYRFIPALRAMPMDRFAAIAIALFLFVVFVVQILTSTNIWQTGSIYEIFRFCRRAQRSELATEPKVVVGDYIPGPSTR